MTSTLLRHHDYSLEDEQRQLVDMLAELFAEQAPMSLVRESEPLGFSPELWRTLADNGIVGMAVPESSGGDGGGLVELVLAALEVGRRLAPVPLVDHVVALRLLAAVERAGGEVPLPLSAAVAGDQILSIAPISSWELGAELVPSGAIADAVLCLRDAEIVLLTAESKRPQAANDGSAPVAWWSPDQDGVASKVLLSGEQAVELWQHAHREWRIATAAALAGLVDQSGQIARQYTTERKAFGSVIASFQAVSHQLADLHLDAVTTRNMVLKAAWLADNEPGYRPELAAIAMAHATRCALRSSDKAVHLHGGMGISLETDISVYFRKASAWSLVGGGLPRDIDEIARAVRRRALGGDGPQTTSSHV